MVKAFLVCLLRLSSVLLGAVSSGDAFAAVYEIKLAARMVAVGSKYGSYAIDEGYYPAFHPVVINDDGDLAQPMLTGPNGKAALWVRRHDWLSGRIVFEVTSTNQQITEVTKDGDNGVLFTVSEEATALGIYRYSYDSSQVNLVTTGPLGVAAYRSLSVMAGGVFGAKLSFGATNQRINVYDEDSWVALAATSSADPSSPFYFFHGVHFVDARQAIVHAMHSAQPGDSAIYRLRSGKAPELIVPERSRTGEAERLQLAPWIAGNHHGDLLFAHYGPKGGLSWNLLTGQDYIEQVIPSSFEGQAELFPAAINDAAMVVLRAFEKSGRAIYLRTGDEFKAIARSGDLVKTDLGHAAIGRPGGQNANFNHAPSLNARGDIAFVCDLILPPAFQQSSEPKGIGESIGIGLLVAHRLD